MEVRRFLLLLTLAGTLLANDIIVKEASNSVEKTMNKLENIVSKKGFTTFAIINHQAGANKVRMQLAPSREIIFGNPKMGTLLMQENIHAGLIFPFVS